MPALLLAAGLLALVLLLVLYWRTAQQIALLKAESERLRVVQRDMSADVRARLDEGARTWESVEHEMRPRLDQLEPSLADLTATIEEHLPGVGEARQRVEDLATRLTALEERYAEVEGELRETLGAGVAETGVRFEHVEGAIRTLRDAADQQLADVQGRVATLEEAAATAAAEAEARAAQEAARLEEEARQAAETETDVEAEEEEEGVLAAVEAATDAPATFGSARGPRHAKEGARGRSGARWLFLLALALGLAWVIFSTLA